MKLANKIVLVTGASRGIGAAEARELARAGASVVLAARSLDVLRGLAVDIRQHGGDASAVQMDVTSDESVAEAVATILTQHGRVDAVVNNAGNGGKLGFWIDQNPHTLRQLLEVHLLGMERVTRAVLPSMLSRNQGAIVNVVSALAFAPMAAAAAYCAAKAGVVAFSEALRGELAGRGINILVFAPGHTKTDGALPLKTPQLLLPEQVARDLVRSLVRQRRLFICGASNRNLVRLKRLFPWLADRIITQIGLNAMSRMSPRQG